MAIEFDCPNCGEHYRLRDDVGGKKAKCKNPQCGKMMLIPAPKQATVPPTTPPPDVEAAAHFALTEEPKAEAQAAAIDIPLTCTSCDHQWTVPAAMAGKNVLCPECTHRIKVPVPKTATPTDWRQSNAGKPSLAKENFEKPKDVISSEGQVVSREAWQKGGGAEQDLEPIPLKRKLMFIVPIVLAVVGVGLGIRYWITSIGHEREAKLFDEARTAFADGADLPPAEAPLFSSILNLAEAEHDLRHKKIDRKLLDSALSHYSKARADLNMTDVKDAAARTQAVAERTALACELALFSLEFGGTDDQVKGETRIRWDPSQLVPKKSVGEKVPRTVHDELQKTLAVVRAADADTRQALTRRLTREYVKRGRPEMAEEVAAFLFDGPDREDARAMVALELFRANAGGTKPKDVADEQLRTYTAKPKTEPGKAPPPAVAPPPFVQGLWLTVNTSGKPPPGVAPLGGGGVPDATRTAYVCQFLCQDKPAEALALANRPGDAAVRVRALVLCAEWSADPVQPLEAARAIIGKGGLAVAPFQGAVFRLAQLAAAANRPDLATALADAIPDEGLRAWAKGEAVRLRMTPENAQPADEAWAEVPGDAKQLRAGHAWGRLWVARQNARVMGDQSKQKKAINTWPSPVHPFGLAGIALGLQDRDLR